MLRSLSLQGFHAQDKMGGAKQQYQEMLEAMTDTSEELAKKTLELLERNMEIVELKGCIRALKKQLLECHDLIREHCDMQRDTIFDWEQFDARIMATQRKIRIT